MNNTATQIASAATIEVTAQNAQYDIFLPGELRNLLPTHRAQALLAELDAIAELDSKWLDENYDSDGYSEAPLYAVSIFEEKHSAEDLGMLRGHLQDALLGTDGLQESRVAFLTRIRREAEDAFADIP